MNGRLLVFNCHEAWVHQLRLLDRPIDVVIDLPGRHTRGWDESIRPVPPNARLIPLNDVLAAPETYDCIVAHNLTDLLDVRSLPGPRLMVIHLTLDGMFLEQNAKSDPSEFRRAVTNFLAQTNTHVVAVSQLKGCSWGFAENIVPLCIDPADYLPCQGDLAAGLRVSNFVLRRARTLFWDFHESAFAGLPVTLVGNNPELPGVLPSRDWNDLKHALSHHRFFIHTADPKLEDGYNTATLEAMAAGLPILGNRNPSSPITDGTDGFLSDNPAELRQAAELLLKDRALAAKMGVAARQTAQQRFAPAKFTTALTHAIAVAQSKCQVSGRKKTRVAAH